MRLFDLRNLTRCYTKPVRWHYWPISFGWVRNSCHAFICWHGWPVTGAKMNPDATYYNQGWTLHIGALKVYFGKRRTD